MMVLVLMAIPGFSGTSWVGAWQAEKRRRRGRINLAGLSPPSLNNIRAIIRSRMEIQEWLKAAGPGEGLLTE